ncbi:hypothetical protein EON65_07100 [archaeon]|nr:MAG: hypothetical protein EON65_07100 [archaeon]
MSEMKVFREKTVSRIIDKRRHDKLRKIHEDEEKNKETNAFRRHWLEDFKHKRSKEIVDAVDNLLVASSIPDAINNKVSFRAKKQENECRLQQLTSGLDDVMHDNLEIKRDSGQYTMAIERDRTSAQFEFRSDEKKSLADRFLHGIVASSLRKRLKDKSFLYELSSASKVLQDNSTSANTSGLLNNSINGKRPFTNTPSNELQINQLIKELSNLSIGDSSPRKRQLVGHIKKLLVLAQRSNWSDIRLTSDPQSTVSSTLIGDKLTTTTTSAAAGRLTAEHDKVSLFRCPIVEGCYLVGPDKRGIMDFVKSKRSSMLSSDDMSTAESNAGSVEGKRASSMKRSSEEMKKVLEPQVLYNTTGGTEPIEMLALLPSYCFPIGSEVVLTLSQDKRGGLESSMANGTSKKGKKKVKVFFPSDFTIDNAADKTGRHMSGQNSGTPAAAPSMSEKVFNIAAPTLSSLITTYVLLIGDHTSQRYCMCFQIPVTFVDPEFGVNIETHYTLCVLTRFPFYNYFFHLFFKIDEEKKLFTFEEPLSVFDPNFPVHPDLKNMDELMFKLRKVAAPIYPYFILERCKPTVENINAHTDVDSFFSYQPNIKMSLKLKNAEIDVLEFHRSFYQRFYTNIGHPSCDEDNDLLASAIRLYEKNLKPDFAATLSHKQEKDKEDSFFALQWALPTLLRHLPLDQIILALGCALTEMNIIVKHKDINVVSSVITALMHLLKPLKWCSPVIVSLPEQLNDAMGKFRLHTYVQSYYE